MARCCRIGIWSRGSAPWTTVYRLSSAWPREEVYGLTSQARRAAVSVPANIAEGYGRDNLGAYLHFLKIAQGSLKELETHFEVAQRVGYLTDEMLITALEETAVVGKILRGLIKSLSGKQDR